MATVLTPLEIMTRLVSFPTVSHDTNLPLVDWVQAYLASHGIESHRWVDPRQPHKAATTQTMLGGFNASCDRIEQLSQPSLESALLQSTLACKYHYVTTGLDASIRLLPSSHSCRI